MVHKQAYDQLRSIYLFTVMQKEALDESLYQEVRKMILEGTSLEDVFEYLGQIDPALRSNPSPKRRRQVQFQSAPMARTEKIEAQMGLIETQKKLGKLKAEKVALENKEKRAMIQLFLTAVEAVERIGAGQAVEADFELLDNLKQIGVKIPPKIKSVAFLLKQTNGEGLENAE